MDFDEVAPMSRLFASGGSAGKESACNVRDLDSIPGLGKFPGGGNSNPLQYSCLKNPMDCLVGAVLGGHKDCLSMHASFLYFIQIGKVSTHQ